MLNLGHITAVSTFEAIDPHVNPYLLVSSNFVGINSLYGIGRLSPHFHMRASQPDVPRIAVPQTEN